jgi:hypothetical protein
MFFEYYGIVEGGVIELKGQVSLIKKNASRRNSINRKRIGI